jgi:cation/acetate symporter
LPADGPWKVLPFIRTRDAEGTVAVWSIRDAGGGQAFLDEAQTLTKRADGQRIVNGRPIGTRPGENQLHPVGQISHLPGGMESTGPLGPLEFFSTLQQSEVVLWASQKVIEADGSVTTVFYQKPTPGSQVLRPGEHPTFNGIRSGKLFDKLNFLSLMLALFCGTASLPHILIRYYTVKDEAAARKSTIVGIACIGFFYVLTLYMGLGAMTSGALDPSDSNMAAPLLARSFSELLFAVISAIAFTTVLGTVSGLILASAGAVTHDLLESFSGVQMNDHERVRVAKLTSVVVGVVAIALGILFKELNVSYLVGWAFSVAASANLPALVMMLFWRRTTYQGVIAAVVVGMVSSLAWILLSGDTFSSVYGLPKEYSPVPFSQPGIVTIPLGFATLVAVSLLTRGKRQAAHA